MGCNSCGGGSTSNGIVNINAQQLPRRLDPQAAGAMLVQYVGDKSGGMEYRANTEATYKFAAGDEPMYVHPADIEFFSMRDDFRIIEGSAAEAAPQIAPPVMVSEPVSVEAEVNENLGALAETTKRTRKKAGALPDGVTPG